MPGSMDVLHASLAEVRRMVLWEWGESLIAAGLDKGVSSKCAAEVMHVVESIQAIMKKLDAVAQVDDINLIPKEIYRLIYVVQSEAQDMIEPMEYLSTLIEPLLPPEPDDNDEDDAADESV